MEKLDPKYYQRLEEIKQEMLDSELYATFMESEEEEDYASLQEMMSPKLSELYHQVANERPLQLLEFERALLDEELEGMFLPRMFGYTAMRGVIDTDTYKYILPQEHFKEVLLAICQSPNFDFLRTRVGQTIQLGFGLSSDIWVTNLINQIANRKVASYLRAQKDSKYRFLEPRKELYNRYLRQFRNDNYFTVVFPKNKAELPVLFPELKNFLYQRIKLGVADKSLTAKLVDFLLDRSYFGMPELFELLVISANFVTSMDDEQRAKVAALFNELREEKDTFDEDYLKLVLEFYEEGLPLDETCDRQMLTILKPTGEEDNLYEFYKLANLIHEKGFTNPEVIEAVRRFYNNNPGTSLTNAAVRNIILGYAGKFADNLEPEAYQDFFELMDIFGQYIEIFDNQKFAQRIKAHALKYIQRLLKLYTDKRGKDYQAIKRFVMDKFQALDFMKEKELINMFKTRRPRRKKTPQT